MIEIEIPKGAQTFFDGMFYKINEAGRSFYWSGYSWDTTRKRSSEVLEFIKNNPSLIVTLKESLEDWKDHHHKCF